MTMTNDQLTALAKALVDAATQKNLTLRVWGGVGVLLTCSSIATHATLQRSYKDVDFIAPRAEFDALAELFIAQGLVAKAREEFKWHFEKDGEEIELGAPDPHGSRQTDYSTRLRLSTPTMPLANLLLLKLVRTPFTESNIQDSIALLLDHRVARGEAEDQIDHEYIAKLCAYQWRVFHTVYDNTVALEKLLDNYLEPEEAQLVWRRIELLQGDMDQQPKSFGWMVNQFLRKPTEVPR